MISPPPDEMRTKTNLEHMQFAKRFGFAVVAAYCGCDVTFESDRELAITNVARHIVGTEYNIHMSPTDFMSLAWVGATVPAKKLPGTDDPARPGGCFAGLDLNHLKRPSASLSVPWPEPPW